MAKKAEEKKTKATEKAKKEKPIKEEPKKASIAKGTKAGTKKTKTAPNVLPTPEIVQNIPVQGPVLSIRDRLIKRVNLPQQSSESQPPMASTPNKGTESASTQSNQPQKKGKPNAKKQKPDEKANITEKPTGNQANRNKKGKPQNKPVIDNTIMTRGLSEKEISAMAQKSKAPTLKLKDNANQSSAGRSGKPGNKKKNKGAANQSESEINKTSPDKPAPETKEIRTSEPPEINISETAQDRKRDKRRDKWNKKNKSKSFQEQPSPEVIPAEDIKTEVAEEIRPENRNRLIKLQPKQEQATTETIPDEQKQSGNKDKHPGNRNKISKQKPKQEQAPTEAIPDEQMQAGNKGSRQGNRNKITKQKPKPESSDLEENIAEEQKPEAEIENLPESRNVLTKRKPIEQPVLTEENQDEPKQDLNQDSRKGKGKKSNKKSSPKDISKTMEIVPDEAKKDTPLPPKKSLKKEPKNKAEKPTEEKPKKKEVKKPRKKYKPLLSKAEKQDVFLINFLAKLEKRLLKNLYLDKESTILLAVSGGVDSIVLLDSMRILAEKYDFYLVVAHYNHNLRGKSADSDETFTGGIARKYDLEFSSAKGNVKKYAKKKSLSLEHAARVLRYQFLERTARNFHCEFIATAHTSDDSAETFLLNLIRGSGLTGLSGIQSKRPLGKNVILVRPLLDFKKDELIEYAQRRKLEWHEDESNYLLNYTRNRIRHELLPMMRQFNPSISDVINRSAELFQGADDFISSHVKIAIENVVFDKKPDRISLKISLLETFNVFLQGELIKLALDKHFQVPGASLSMIDRIISLMNSETGTIFEINNELMAFKDRDIIIISRKSVFTEVNESVLRTGTFKFGDYTLKLEEVSKDNLVMTDDPRIEYFDLELVPSILSVRNWKDGDAFIPLGMKGTMKVSDFLTNNKVSLVDKPEILLLCSKSDIIWVIGQRINDKFKITDSTQKVLRAEIINKRKKDESA